MITQIFAAIVTGLGTGSVFAIAGMGLVLTNKTSGIFNFAHGAQAAAGAFIMWELWKVHGWPWPVAAAGAIVLGGVAGGLILERIAYLLNDKSTAARVVATVGLLVLLQGLIVLGSELISRRVDRPSFPGEELVVVSSPFFPHDLSKGYANANPRVVVSINGVAIRNLRHLVEVIRDEKSDFLTFEFDSMGGETLVFPRKELLASTEDILTDNGVRAQGSPDLLAVWQAKPAR